MNVGEPTGAGRPLIDSLDDVARRGPHPDFWRAFPHERVWNGRIGHPERFCGGYTPNDDCATRVEHHLNAVFPRAAVPYRDPDRRVIYTGP